MKNIFISKMQRNNLFSKKFAFINPAKKSLSCKMVLYRQYLQI